jgi:hypothetical protein
MPFLTLLVKEMETDAVHAAMAAAWAAWCVRWDSVCWVL